MATDKKKSKPRKKRPPQDPNIFMPTKYPVCVECKVPYVMRVAFVLGDKEWVQQWVYQRDCKHKKASHELVKMR